METESKNGFNAVDYMRQVRDELSSLFRATQSVSMTS